MSNKSLCKSQERILGGVCGGIANYAGCSPILVRLIWLVMVFALGFGVVAYIVLWIVMPQPKRRSFQERMEERLHSRPGSHQE